MSKQSLINFEEGIKNDYLDGKIRSPVHFSKGNEDALIEIFEEVNPDDWVFSTHRNHYHALLHGIDREWLRDEILANRSMHISGRRFFTSSIVGGCLPIALGVALGIKRQGLKDWVWVFVGDMAAETGIFYECTKYAGGFNLPITFVIEDNGLSVYTPTKEVWGNSQPARIKRYTYERVMPHHGTGTWVNF